jgi:hypothetical protein
VYSVHIEGGYWVVGGEQFVDVVATACVWIGRSREVCTVRVDLDVGWGYVGFAEGGC